MTVSIRYGVKTMLEIFWFLMGLCFLTVMAGLTVCVIVWVISFVKETIDEWREEDE